MVNWLCKRVGSVESCVCQAIQCRLGQVRLASASQDLHTLQFHRRGRQPEILKFNVFALIQSIYLLCVMASEECMMNNSQKICQGVFKRIKRIKFLVSFVNFEIIASQLCPHFVLSIMLLLKFFRGASYVCFVMIKSSGT